MKRTLIMAVLVALIAVNLPYKANAQAQELEQLALDIQKLAQFKSILAQMKQAYDIIVSGYNKVKGVTEGNFSLHEAFIDGLLLVNPNIRSYGRVADIISYQAAMISEYKSAAAGFKGSHLFLPDEIAYMGNVYANLMQKSLENLDELTLILTASNLRMSDAERLNGIDRIYAEMKDKLTFLRSFNRRTGMLMHQRQQLQDQQSTLKSLYGQ